MPISPNRHALGLISASSALVVIALMGNSAQAAQITVNSTTGQPLEDAVVEVYYETASTANSTPEHNIYQRDATFHPHVLSIPTGSYVAFPNEDNTRHHVYSFSPAKTFDLNLYLHETPPPVHFEQAGVVALGCNIHDHMEAFIVVTDAPYAAITDSDGKLELPTLPAGQHRIRVWHSRVDDSQQVWWEGTVSDSDNLDITLELNALPPPPPALSPLQQRFNDAT